MTRDFKSDYCAKLRDPRWQKMRLEVMNRDEFTCRKCGDKGSTLNVNHKYYMQGKNPWEYPLYALVTLCEACHEEEEEARRDAPLMFQQILSAKGMLNSEMIEVVFGLAGVAGGEILQFLHGIREGA